MKISIDDAVKAYSEDKAESRAHAGAKGHAVLPEHVSLAATSAALAAERLQKQGNWYLVELLKYRFYGRSLDPKLVIDAIICARVGQHVLHHDVAFTYRFGRDSTPEGISDAIVEHINKGFRSLVAELKDQASLLTF